MATISSASCGHAWNQSMVQQLMREGNIRRRFLKASPMGLMARTTCKFACTRSMKKLYMERGVASILRPDVLAATCIFSMISAFSSGG